MKLFRAVCYKDYSETEYLTRLDKVFKTKKEAEDALANTFGDVKFIKEIEVES